MSLIHSFPPKCLIMFDRVSPKGLIKQCLTNKLIHCLIKQSLTVYHSLNLQFKLTGSEL